MKWPNIFSVFLTLFFVTGVMMGCSSEDNEDTYPNIITEFASIQTDKSGNMVSFTTDDDKTYQISNPINGYEPNAIYRVVCGFVSMDNQAEVYQLYGAYFLRDSVDCAQHDPTGITSLWRRGHFINLQLSPLTQGGTQYWGFITDSIHSQHAFLSLHHRQGEDPLSFSKTVYASIPLDSIAEYDPADTITLVIQTFDGPKTYEFVP